MARSPDPLAGALDGAEDVAAGVATVVEPPAVLELLELPPQAAMNAANPVAAAPVPIVLPAIFRNFLRSTSSRANS
jgi:hypothetical protein